MGMTNATIWDNIRGKYPSFASHTSKATADLFTERGWETIQRTDPKAVDEFFELSVRIALIAVNVSHAKDTLEAKGFGEYFDAPFGQIVQKMATTSVKPVSPKYRGYKDGDSIDPFVVRLPKITERAFVQNFDYQSGITMPDEFSRKVIFVSDFGMSEFMAGIMEGLENGYKIQKYENKLEALNKAINSTKHPLQDTQKVTVTQAGAEMTSDELIALILSIKNVVSAMDLAPQTGAYNALKYESTQDLDRLKLLVRPGYKNAIDALVLANAFNQDKLNLPIDVIEVPNFGGLEYYQDAAFAKPLYTHYDAMGAEDGFTATKDGSALYTGEVHVKDPNAGVIGIIADKGLVFECRQNPYTVEPIRNPRGMYTNYWANCPGSTVAVDPLYNMVAISKA